MTFCQRLIATTTPHITTMQHRLIHYIYSLKMPSSKEQPIVIHTLHTWIFLATSSRPSDLASILSRLLHSVIQYTNKSASLKCFLPSRSDPETLIAFTLIPKPLMQPQKPWSLSSAAITKDIPTQPCLPCHTQFLFTGVTFQSLR